VVDKEELAAGIFSPGTSVFVNIFPSNCHTHISLILGLDPRIIQAGFVVDKKEMAAGIFSPGTSVFVNIFPSNCHAHISLIL